MNIRLFHEVATALLNGEACRYDTQGVAVMAQQIAEMVGWAPGAIDPKGGLQDELERLRQTARQRYEREPQPVMASLHDAIADLMDAIARHDRDLRGDSVAEDDVVGF